MKIFKITVENFRLLKNFSIDIEDEISLIVGKNNTGKSSILSVLDKFLNSSKFSFDDFNVDHKEKLKKSLQNNSEEISTEEDFLFGIKLKIFIKYDVYDNLSNISKVMVDLDPNINEVVLGFEYGLDHRGYQSLKEEYLSYKKLYNNKSHDSKIKENSQLDKDKFLYDFLDKKHSDFFKIKIKSFALDNLNNKNNNIDDKNYIIINNKDISSILNFKFISAKRDVNNQETNKILSKQTSQIYEQAETNEQYKVASNEFKVKLSETDYELSDIYKKVFQEVINKVKSFGGIKVNENEISIVSTLQQKELLAGNTKVIYSHSDGHYLPEYYNGLGYMNLMSMIFEIEIITHKFKKMPSDINLLFIEEPEAHTHPQMQYIFIKNIKKLIKGGIKIDNGEKRELQYIISTHSSHIVADSDFNDIKYLQKEDINKVMAKNLKDLEEQYTNNKHYGFLKQYLTINRSEIFFADKVILIEGDTERILLPTMMKKIDLEKDGTYPLLSQNISIIEVGAYAHIFAKFIAFLGIKTLIITDIDSVKKEDSEDNKEGYQKCKVSDGEVSSNPTLNFFFNEGESGKIELYKLKKRNDINKRQLKFRDKNNEQDEKWIEDNEGNLLVAFQNNEKDYCARSFEDAFIHLNKTFIKDCKDTFEGLKKKNMFCKDKYDAYDLADECIKKKSGFALDILLNSDEELSNWEIPKYIKEGLLWLQKD